jgi:hypothetical protein
MTTARRSKDVFTDIRPVFISPDKTAVDTNYGLVSWDAKNDCVRGGPDSDDGKLLAKALAENGMTYPDPWTEPLPRPEPIPPNAPPAPGWDAPLPDEPMLAEESTSGRIVFRDEGV